MSSIIGQPTILYPSGMAAFWAILLHVRPDVIAITGGYGGCHEAIKIYRRTRGEDQVDLIKLDDDFPSASEKKLLVWVETPLNPTGESRSLDKCALHLLLLVQVVARQLTSSRACRRQKGARSRRPPRRRLHLWPPSTAGPLQVGCRHRDACVSAPSTMSAWEECARLRRRRAEYIRRTRLTLHSPRSRLADSGTKYFNGHSDVLAGTVSVRDKADWHKLWNDRTFTGANIGSLDVWLLLRSLRTLDVRVRRQSKTATRIAQWLATQVGGGVVDKVHHAALQENAEDLLGPGKQMELGPACFSVVLSSKEIARALPNKLRCFIVRRLRHSREALQLTSVLART